MNVGCTLQRTLELKILSVLALLRSSVPLSQSPGLEVEIEGTVTISMKLAQDTVNRHWGHCREQRCCTGPRICKLNRSVETAQQLAELTIVRSN
jgi:hypothetical protein